MLNRDNNNYYEKEDDYKIALLELKHSLNNPGEILLKEIAHDLKDFGIKFEYKIDEDIPYIKIQYDNKKVAKKKTRNAGRTPKPLPQEYWEMTIQELLDKIKASSLKKVAAEMGIPASTLRDRINNHSKNVEAGRATNDQLVSTLNKKCSHL